MFLKEQLKEYLVQLFLVTEPLHLSLETLPALGELALVGMLGYEVRLLLLVFHRVLALLVFLQVPVAHTAPPHVPVQTDLTLEVEVLQVDVLDVSL